jgi:chemotaxis response regulator CheB
MVRLGHHIVVIGGSAGSGEAMKILAGHLKEGLPALIFVVLHMSPDPLVPF